MWNPFAIVASFLADPDAKNFFHARAAQVLSLRWQRAVQVEPMIIADIITLGRVLAKQPAEFRNGVEVPTPIDPSRVLIDAGRRELALELLALCKIDQAALAKMIGEQE